MNPVQERRPTRVLPLQHLSTTLKTFNTSFMNLFWVNFENTKLSLRSYQKLWVEENGVWRRTWRNRNLFIGSIISLKRGMLPPIGLPQESTELKPYWGNRYPTFTDSLRDVDDALSLIVLFACLPATPSVPAAIIANCAKLAAQWQLYVMRTKSLRKVFLSIKGIYFQAEVQGQTITWLVPYMFTQNVCGSFHSVLLFNLIPIF